MKDNIIDIITIEPKLFDKNSILRIVDDKIKKKRYRNRIASANCRSNQETKLQELSRENEKLRSELKILRGYLFRPLKPLLRSV